MSVENTNPRIAGPFFGNGTTVLSGLAFPFLVFEAADIVVSWTDSAGNVTYPYAQLVLGTDYTVVLNADQVSSPGCTIATTAVLPVSTSLTITSAVANTIDVEVAGAAAAPINAGFDRLCVLIQQLAAQMEFVPSVPAGGINQAVPASLVFGVGLNSSGQAVPVLSQLAEISQTAVSSFVATALGTTNIENFMTNLGASSWISGWMSVNTYEQAQISLHLVPGAAAGNLVELDSSARLPAVDGSQLLSLPLPSRPCCVLSAQGDSNFGTSWLSIAGTGVGVAYAASSSAPAVLSFPVGFWAGGRLDRIEALTSNAALAWNLASNLSSTQYLYVMRTGVHTMTFGQTPLPPIYQLSPNFNAANNAAGQYTFVVNQNQWYLGNGSAAVAVGVNSTVVFVGEAVVGASAVSSVTAYALNGMYQQYDTAVYSAGASVTVTHNLGLGGKYGSSSVGGGSLYNVKIEAVCTTAEYGYQVGDVVDFPSTSGSSTNNVLFGAAKRRNSLVFACGANAALQLLNLGTGAPVNPTSGNWNMRVTVDRGF